MQTKLISLKKDGNPAITMSYGMYSFLKYLEIETSKKLPIVAADGLLKDWVSWSRAILPSKVFHPCIYTQTCAISSWMMIRRSIMRKIILAVVIASSSLLSASYALDTAVKGFEHEVKPANKEHISHCVPHIIK